MVAKTGGLGSLGKKIMGWVLLLVISVGLWSVTGNFSSLTQGTGCSGWRKSCGLCSTLMGKTCAQFIEDPGFHSLPGHILWLEDALSQQTPKGEWRLLLFPPVGHCLEMVNILSHFEDLFLFWSGAGLVLTLSLEPGGAGAGPRGRWKWSCGWLGSSGATVGPCGAAAVGGASSSLGWCTDNPNLGHQNLFLDPTQKDDNLVAIPFCRLSFWRVCE